ncbi:hypothetical protein ASF09_19285 [Sphingomonas sp. Leaf242]|jgi:hypothetical protein|nr:hypothetical protein ASF09_19285 [Sphingomonas sp. Leaf242]
MEIAMPSTVSVRLLQALLGTAYLFLAAVALAKATSLVTLLVAAGAMLVSYLTARRIPDAFVSPNAVFGICAIGLAIICIGMVADAVGGTQAQEWVAIVMAYCAGNRFRAAGIGPTS